MPGITKFDAARQQLDRAIGLLDEDDVSAHTLAYAAYRILREMLGDETTRNVLLQVEKNLNIGEVPGFLSHARTDPGDILNEHSAKTVHLTITLTIKLWEEYGHQQQTADMQQFWKRENPYKRGYRHGVAVEVARDGPFSDLSAVLTQPSTVSALISRYPCRETKVIEGPRAGARTSATVPSRTRELASGRTRTSDPAVNAPSATEGLPVSWIAARERP
jgi:hypothetical protein